MLNKNSLIFSSIMFCYFLDRGPSSIDYFFNEKIKEDPDLTAVRLMTKSVALVKGDTAQQVEQSIIDQLSGPDIFPVDTEYRMVWYNWLIANKFSTDSRIRNSGSIAGIYCIYRKNKETIIRNSLHIIENILRNMSTEFQSIDDIIKKQCNLSSSTLIGEKQFHDFINRKKSNIITKQLNKTLNIRIQEYLYQYGLKYVSQIEKFKIILQQMVFKKGTPEEIIDKAEKRRYWNSVIEELNQIISNRMPNLNIKKGETKQLEIIYNILLKEKIWTALSLNDPNPIIQTKDVANFFFYYLLAHHQLLKRKKIVQLFIDLTK
ncbi:hypothetical protein [Candidatus Hodarchaeum mangrovi]